MEIKNINFLLFAVTGEIVEIKDFSIYFDGKNFYLIVAFDKGDLGVLSFAYLKPHKAINNSLVFLADYELY